METKRKFVKVIRRGETTIPVRSLARLEDLAGVLSKTTSVERVKKLLDESREDED